MAGLAESGDVRAETEPVLEERLAKIAAEGRSAAQILKSQKALKEKDISRTRYWEKNAEFALALFGEGAMRGH